MVLFLTTESKQWISRLIFLAFLLYISSSSSVACRTDLDCVTAGENTGYEWHCEWNRNLNQSSSSSGNNDTSTSGCVTCRSHEYWDRHEFKCKYKSFNSTTDFVLGIIIILIVAIAVLYSAIKWLYLCCKCYSVTLESQNNMAQIMNDAVGVIGFGPPGDGIMGSGPANRRISTDTVSTVMGSESASWSSSIYSIGAGTGTGAGAGAGSEPFPNTGAGNGNGEGPGPISYH